MRKDLWGGLVMLDWVIMPGPNRKAIVRRDEIYLEICNEIG